MHIADFVILLRSIHYSAKLQIAKIHKNAPKVLSDFTWAIQVQGSEMSTQQGRHRVQLLRETKSITSKLINITELCSNLLWNNT